MLTLNSFQCAVSILFNSTRNIELDELHSNLSKFCLQISFGS